MSLRDEHLQQALNNAPDKDAVPSNAVRQKVLGYASKAVNPTRAGFFARGIKRFNDWRITSWQLVGMSTVASVLLVTVMLRDQLPSETPWLSEDEQDMAQAQLESATTSKSQQEALAPRKEVATESTEDLDVRLPEPIVEDEAGNRAKDKLVKAKRKASVVEAPKPLAKKAESPVVGLAEKKETVDRLASSDATAPSEPPVAIAVEEPVDMAESADLAGLEMADEVTLETERPRAAAKAGVVARKQDLPAKKLVSGEMLARRDIHAGNYRILTAGDSWSENKVLIDDETGYRIEDVKNTSIQLSEEAIASYNNTMRQWYHANKHLAD